MCVCVCVCVRARARVCVRVRACVRACAPVYNLHHQVPVIRTLMKEMDSISEMVLYLKHLV